MLVKVLSAVLLAYGAVGLIISVLSDWAVMATQAKYIFVYVVMPWLGVLALQKKSRITLFLVLLTFAFISVRLSFWASSFPIIAPISMSITYGDFANGTGALVDLFAIIVVILIAGAIRQLNNENSNDPKPT